MKGKVYSLNISKLKGTAKKAVKRVTLVPDFGVENDAHAGKGEKQVSLLAFESIQRQKECPKSGKSKAALGPGDFAENITTEGLNLIQLKVGDKLKVGTEVILEIEIYSD